MKFNCQKSVTQSSSIGSVSKDYPFKCSIRSVLFSLNFEKGIFEFAKLRASRAFAPYVPSYLTCLRDLRAFAPYVPYLRALSTRLARFICTSLGWIYSPAETFHFPRTIKDTVNRTVIVCAKKKL